MTVCFLLFAAFVTRRESYIGQAIMVVVYTISLLVATIATACVCTRNFNKGLKPHIQKRKVVNPDENKASTPSYFGGGDLQGPSSHQLGNLQNRMTID